MMLGTELSGARTRWGGPVPREQRTLDTMDTMGLGFGFMEGAQLLRVVLAWGIIDSGSSSLK